DVGNVFSYFKGNRNGVLGTSFHQFLERLNSNDPNIRLPEIISKLEEDPERSKFIEECKIIGKGTVKPYLAAILFLKWKDELRNPEKTLVSSNVFYNGQVSFYNKYPDEVRLALQLLAAFFGFNRFYDESYNIANYKFFKNYTAVTDTVKSETPTIASVEKENDQVSSSSKKEELIEEVSITAI